MLILFELKVSRVSAKSVPEPDIMLCGKRGRRKYRSNEIKKPLNELGSLSDPSGLVRERVNLAT
ncbi:hypothetical protein DPMN_095027 [Dreissena polymorpha]|uniref:Uncharacterized protein n=1 Tax=Dreissena polymorpha TaxID=45954 RepID=A0A9D4L650_DREPO|nr:hypothetical protein DPMN_095027 [Dreissena polymorpha]